VTRIDGRSFSGPSSPKGHLKRSIPLHEDLIEALRAGASKNTPLQGGAALGFAPEYGGKRNPYWGRQRDAGRDRSRPFAETGSGKGEMKRRTTENKEKEERQDGQSPSAPPSDGHTFRHTYSTLLSGRGSGSESNAMNCLRHSTNPV